MCYIDIRSGRDVHIVPVPLLVLLVLHLDVVVIVTFDLIEPPLPWSIVSIVAYDKIFCIHNANFVVCKRPTFTVIKFRAIFRGAASSYPLPCLIIFVFPVNIGDSVLLRLMFQSSINV